MTVLYNTSPRDALKPKPAQRFKKWSNKIMEERFLQGCLGIKNHKHIPPLRTSWKRRLQEAERVIIWAALLYVYPVSCSPSLSACWRPQLDTGKRRYGGAERPCSCVFPLGLVHLSWHALSLSQASEVTASSRLRRSTTTPQNVSKKNDPSFFLMLVI